MPRQRRPPPRTPQDLTWGWSWPALLLAFWFAGAMLSLFWYAFGDRIRRAWGGALASIQSGFSHFLHSPRGMVVTVIGLTILLLAFHNQRLAGDYRTQTTDLPKPRREPSLPPPRTQAHPQRDRKPPPPPSAQPRRAPRAIKVRHRRAAGPGPPLVQPAEKRAVQRGVKYQLSIINDQLSIRNPQSAWPSCSPLDGAFRPPRVQGTDAPAHAKAREQRSWVFCHMPKTGGMTMRTVLERGARHDKQHVAHLAKNYDAPACARGRKCNGILGTQSLPQLRSVYGAESKPTLLTMLREPVERSYSAYHYVLRESNKPIHRLYKANTLEALLRGQRFYNDIGLGRNAYTRVLSDFLPTQAEQCRQLKNHTGRWSDRLEGAPYWDCLLDIAKTVLRDHMHLVCVTERYAQCLELASQELFPEWLERKHFSRIPRRNAARRPHRRSEQVDAMLRVANHQDLELYGYARALFDCRWRRHQAARLQNVRSWGNNAHGVLGLGSAHRGGSVDAPTAVDDDMAITPMVQVGGGGGVWDWSARNPSVCGSFALALAANGTLYSAGWNKWNLLGRKGARRGAPDSPQFDKVDLGGHGGNRASSFAAGHRHALAVVEPGGRVFAWGMNGYGQLGTGSPSKDLGPQRAPPPAPVQGLPRDDPVIQVAAGGRHSVAVTRSGQVWVWGLNDADMLGLGMAQQHVTSPQQVRGLLEHEQVASVCAGTRHSAALTRTGEIYEWGWKACSRQQMRLCKIPYFVQTALPEGAQQIMQLTCTGGANFALDAVGSLYSWGTNAVAELGLGMPGKDTQELFESPQKVEGLPPLTLAQTSYDYTPGFHGGATLALSVDQQELWVRAPLCGASFDDERSRVSQMWGPLVGGLDRLVASKDRKGWLKLEDARKRCQRHNDGHLEGQLERCAKELWQVVAPRPVKLSRPGGLPWEWATAGLANRGSVYFVTR